MGEAISAVEVMFLTWRRCDDSSKRLSEDQQEMDEVTGRQERGSCSSRGGKEKDMFHGQYNEFLLGVWVNEQR
jgi:hypothetical protein